MSTTFWIVLITLYTLLAIFIVISLLIRGVRPSKSLAWLLAIFTIPVGGMFLYFIFGRNQRKKRLSRLIDTTLPFKAEKGADLLPSNRISNIIGKTTNYHPTINNSITLLKDGQKTFDSIFEALEKAQNFIHIQYYIFEDGELADRLLELFTRKRSEQVTIRLIYDSIGSLSLSRKYINALKNIGVEVYAFLPMQYGRYLSSLNYRNHRKIIIVDGYYGFTGGINISDKYLKGDPNLGVWHDMHMKLEGYAVYDLNDVFLKDWQVVSKERIENSLKPDLIRPKGISTVQIAPDGPNNTFGTIEHLFLSIINSSRKQLFITNPYIIPSLPVQRALENAALSGVDVRLLLSQKADSIIINWCVRSYFETLLTSGIRIFLYPEGFLHSKIIVADKEVATIGTANLDERSFKQNYEVNAVIYDADIATTLSSDFLNDCEKSIEIKYKDFSKRSLSERLKQGAARMLSPLL